MGNKTFADLEKAINIYIIMKTASYKSDFIFSAWLVAH